MSTSVATAPIETDKQLCAVCKNPAEQRCSGCNEIYYCTREHQKSDWKSHSKICRVFELAKDNVLGRHYIASRNIKAGELVLKEKPLIEVPHLMGKPVCLNCYSPLNQWTAKPCKECGMWPLCLACTDHPDCKVAKTYLQSKFDWRQIAVRKSDPFYMVVIILRALALRDSDLKAYEKLLSLEDLRQKTEKVKWCLDSSLGMRYVATLYARRLLKEGVIEDEEIGRIIGIVMVNAHENLLPHSHAAVYHKGSFFEHNCRANCSKSSTKDGGIIIRAVVPISKGDHISIFYTNPLYGTIKRRSALAEGKFFDCMCERCKDPTDFGTMFNAIACFNRPCTGYILPETFLVPERKDLNFVCLKCKEAMPWVFVKGMLKTVAKSLAGIEKDDVNGYRSFLEIHSNLLHGNHFYMFSARLNLAGAIGEFKNRGSNVSAELLAEKITHCRKLEVLMNIIMPAENRLRGTVLFHKYASLMEYANNQLPDQAASTKSKEEAKKAIVEAYNLLRDEQISTPEGRMGKQALIILEKHWNIVPGSSAVTIK